MSKKQNYIVDWPGLSLASLANVSFTASSREGIIKQVKQIARQVGLINTKCYVHLAIGRLKVMEGIPTSL